LCRRMKTRVYIDGFNLYYGAVKGTRYRWLNIARMCELLLPGYDLAGYKYFTAIVSARPDDPQKPIRQQMYVRALETIPNLEVILGHFKTHQTMMPLVNPTPGGPRFVRVWRTEEKGSDVNLATNLLNDAYLDRYDIAVIISNDSDLVAPIRIVREQIGKAVGIINPQKKSGKALYAKGGPSRRIRVGVLAQSQFPATIHDRHGIIVKPGEW